MLSTKSLGKLNSLFTQEELQYNMPRIEIPGDAYYSKVTDGYLYYSDLMTIINGALTLKQGGIPARSVIITLPIAALNGGGDFIGYQITPSERTAVPLWIDQEGKVRSTVRIDVTDSSTLLYMSTVFPSKIIGGGVIDSLLRKFMTFFSRKEVMNYA